MQYDAMGAPKTDLKGWPIAGSFLESPHTQATEATGAGVLCIQGHELALMRAIQEEMP